MRDLIAESWRRCREVGVDPQQRRTPASPHTVPPDPSRADVLRRAAASVLARMSALLRESRTLAALCDADGIILDVEGDLRTRMAAEQIHLVAGTDWSEAGAGTNGMGTALKTGDNLLVTGDEHYCRGLKDWDSGAALVRDPFDSLPAACFGLFGPKGTHNPHWPALVSVAAALIQTQLAAIARDREMERHAEAADEGSPSPSAGGRPPHGATIDPPGLRSGRGLIAALNVPPFAVKPHHKPGQMRPAAGDDPFSRVIGSSTAIQRAKHLALRLSSVNVPTLLRGPTGVGKEVIARAIHEASDRRKAPFIAVNCGAIPRDLLGSELFGFSDGAFTGARRGGLPGKFEAADGGTLFLDEIGEMSLDHQPYLLRAVENGEIFRIGETRPRRVDIRILAATNRRLEEEVANRRFREDLLFRLSVTVIELPRLQDRHGDIPLLATHFARKAAQRHGLREKLFSASALGAMERYNWPGNVRELQNLVEQLTILTPGPWIESADLPAEIAAAALQPSPGASTSLDAAERSAILSALIETGWNASRSARLLGIAKSTLYLKMARHGLRRDESPPSRPPSSRPPSSRP